MLMMAKHFYFHARSRFVGFFFSSILSILVYAMLPARIYEFCLQYARIFLFAQTIADLPIFNDHICSLAAPFVIQIGMQTYGEHFLGSFFLNNKKKKSIYSMRPFSGI